MVDSSETSVPGRSSRPAVCAAARTALRSGPSASDSGVGTQITITSCGLRSAGSAVAVNPWSRAAATSSPVTSPTWDRPAFRPRVIAVLVSNPVTRNPARAAWTASGKPT